MYLLPTQRVGELNHTLLVRRSKREGGLKFNIILGPFHTQEQSWASIESSSTYSLVLFKNSDARPSRLATFRGPFTSAKRLMSCLESVSFLGGQGDVKSCAVEGVAQALWIFDDLQKKRKNYLKEGHNISQYVIFVGNSQSYDMPCQDIPNYMGQNIDDVIKKCQEKSVHFSVISPRKIPQLIRLVSDADRFLIDF